MTKFKKGDIIKSPSGCKGFVLRRRKNQIYMFWLCNLHPKLDDRNLPKNSYYDWQSAHTMNLIESLSLCTKVGKFTEKEYNTYKVLYGDKNEI